MNDSDPRPMPIEIQRAYREPVDLRGLLMSKAYSEQDRRDVLDVLMRSLLEKHGDVWIESGKKDVRVSTRVKQTKKKVVNAIELLSSVEEYGGSEGVLPLLAQAMQPKWVLWWESFEWNERRDIEAWRDAAACVLGQRQLAWLAAQYARDAIDRTRPQDRSVCLKAIESAEAWARVPSEANRRDAAADAAAAARAANAAAYARAAAAYDAASASAYAAANAAWAADAAAASAAAAAYADAAATRAASAAAAAYAAATARLCELTKRLITPTLVTSASGAMHLAKRS